MGVIRLILAISVICAHSESFFGVNFVGGQYAVQIFFMISGFYMSLVLSEKYIGKGSYKLFITNRALKIYPVYFMSLFFVFFVVVIDFVLFKKVAVLTPYFVNYDEINFFSFLFLIVTNLIIFGQDLVMFLGLDKTTGSLFFTGSFSETDPKLFTFLLNPPAWSVSVELMFYIIAPFLLTKRLHIIFMVFIASLCVKMTALYYFSLDHDPWTYRFFFSELMFFMLGAISYRIYVFCLKNNFLINSKMICLSFFILFLFYVVFFYQISHHTYFKNLIFFGLEVGQEEVSSLLLYFLSFTSIPFVFKLTKKWKFDRVVGELSYPIYILHFTVLLIVSKVLGHMSLYGFISETTTLFTVILSILVMFYVVKPIGNYRERRISLSRKKSLYL